MFFRTVTILAVVSMVVGTLVMVGSAFPEAVEVVVSPFCAGDLERNASGDFVVCDTGDDEIAVGEGLMFAGIAGVVAGSFLLMFGIFGGVAAMSSRANRILAMGEAAQARLVGMEHTGVRINSQPMLKFHLDVQPTYGEVYRAETNRIIPFGMMNYFTIGMTVPIKFDPKKPTDVAIDMDAMRSAPMGFSAPAATSSPVDLSAKLKELEETYQQGLISQSEYEAARQRVISGF